MSVDLAQQKVIRALKDARRSIKENVPHQLDTIRAYDTVIEDLEGFDYNIEL